MVIEVRCRSLELHPTTEAHVLAQIARALRSFGHGVRAVTVRLDDLNGPRGGVDKLCRVTVRLTRGGTLMAEGRGESIGQSVAFAAARARGRVRRWTRLHESSAQRRLAS